MESGELLAQSLSTFCYNRVRQIIREAIHLEEDNFTGRVVDFVCADDRLAEEKFFSEPIDYCEDGHSEQDAKGLRACSDLLDAASDAERHLERLDAASKGELDFSVTYLTESEEKIATRACQVLQRLPSTISGYDKMLDDGKCSNLPEAYFVSERNKSPKNLRVLHFIPSVILQMAVQVTLPISKRTNWAGYATLSYVDMVAKRLQSALQLRPSSDVTQDALPLVQIFLWNLWRRSLSLHRWYVLRVHLEYGFTYAGHRALKFYGERIIEKLQCRDPRAEALHEVMHLNETSRTAFELLRSDLTLMGASFEILSSRVSRLRTPLQDCSNNCLILQQELPSHRSGTVSLAVALDPPCYNRIRSCITSKRTMAISLARSGTRDDQLNQDSHLTGIESCLHRRLCTVARKLGCKSYWLSSLCTPADPAPRSEAFAHLNSIWEKCKVMLICDESIMSLEAPRRNRTDPVVSERLLANLLVSEYILQAWSLLETAKGAKALYLLCKDDIAVSLQYIIQTIYARGSVDLATLCLSTYWLLRPNTKWVLANVPTTARCDSPSGIITRRNTRTFGIEEAGQLLSRRRIHQAGDDILIWCLLLGFEPTTDPETFWRNVWWVRTSFLLSPIPRLSGAYYLGWAPESPFYANDQQVQTKLACWYPFQDEESSLGEARHSEAGFNGLDASWQFCSLECLANAEETESMSKRLKGIARHIATRGLGKRPSSLDRKKLLAMASPPDDGSENHVYNKEAKRANESRHASLILQLPDTTLERLYSILRRHPHSPGPVALLRPKQEFNELKSPMTTPYQPRSTRLAVVCSDIRQNPMIAIHQVRWLETLEWTTDVPLPPFFNRKVLIG